MKKSNSTEPQFKELKTQIDKLICSFKPTDAVPHSSEHYKLPPNYTLNIFPNKGFSQKLFKYISLFNKIDPTHLYYPAGRLHITLLGQIDINVDKRLLVTKIEKLLKEYDIQFKILGIGTSRHTASFSAYPLNFSLYKLRENIRSTLRVDTDTYTNAYKYIGWINFLRYRSPPRQELLDKFKSLKETEFGVIKPTEIFLLKNSSRLLEKSKYTVIKRYCV